MTQLLWIANLIFDCRYPSFHTIQYYQDIFNVAYSRNADAASRIAEDAWENRDKSLDTVFYLEGEHE